MDYQRKRGETKIMVRKVSTKTSVPTSEEDFDTNCTEKVESKETEPLKSNLEIQMTREPKTVTKVTKEAAAVITFTVLFVSIWHPYVALLVTLAALFYKVSEDWPDEEEIVFVGDIKKLIANNQTNKTTHTSQDPDFLRGVEFARNNSAKIANAILNRKASVRLFSGWQEHFSDFRSGISAELGIPQSAITEVFPFSVKIVL
jgi:hypothetical protein